MTREKLRSSDPATSVARIIAAARVVLCRRGWSVRGLRGVYEHGQWWVVNALGGQWSVGDASGPGTVNGFDFERVTEEDD